MKSMPKWLFVPLAAALLVVLGPLSMQGSGPADNGTAKAATPPAAAAQPDDTVNGPAGSSLRAPSRTPTLPRTPDFLEIGSALAGVLLLGIGGVLVLRKLRGGASPTGGATIVTLRQSLRLSQRQQIHALEFDDRILLIGESERGLTLLESGRQPERVADEVEVLSRRGGRVEALVGDDDDDGAVPKNLVIPRPTNGPSRHAPTPPKTPAANKTGMGLNDFRTLLQKAGR